jgi:hypothetical protein
LKASRWIVQSWGSAWAVLEPTIVAKANPETMAVMRAVERMVLFIEILSVADVIAVGRE